jgi:SAM-dependent methyltransferase
MRACLVCGGRGEPYAKFNFWAEYRFDLLWCGSCEVGWVAELPDATVFADAYERLNVLSWKDRKPEELANDIRRAYLKGARVGRQFLSYRPDLRGKKVSLLEVGSNIGVVMRGALDAVGSDPSSSVGIDFSRNHAEVAEKRLGIRTLVATLEEAAASLDRKFDLILCHHIIEHDENPGRFLEHLKRLLAPGGILSFELPNGKREAHCIHLDDRAGKHPYSLINHINFFSPSGFGKLLARNGWQVRHLCSLNANRVLHDYGLWRKKARFGSQVPSLREVENRPIVEVFPPEAISAGLRKGRRSAPFIRLTHRLRPHYAPGLPLGTDIEAYAGLPC